MLGERVVAVGSCVVTAEARPEDADRLRRVMQWLPTYLGMYVGTLAKKSLRLKQRLLGIRDTLNDLRPTGVYNVSLFRSRRTTVGQSFSILRSLHPTYPVVVFCASSHTVHKLAPEPPFAQKKPKKNQQQRANPPPPPPPPRSATYLPHTSLPPPTAPPPRSPRPRYIRDAYEPPVAVLRRFCGALVADGWDVQPRVVGERARRPRTSGSGLHSGAETEVVRAKEKNTATFAEDVVPYITSLRICPWRVRMRGRLGDSHCSWIVV